ncbi:hypothetical protein ABGN05_13930 [Aquibium sp. LZ166]|uniref:Uncharacterized protein n=1 Tax=Aquibium pacificus TaxID=3153579 RepID=A0ABV3SJ38_9HYPH
MMSSRSEIPLEGLKQTEIDWLVRQGVTVPAMVKRTTIRSTTGVKAADGRFEFEEAGDRWLAFEQEDDVIFWQPRVGAVATYAGRDFALGEDVLDDAATYAFDYSLNILADPLDWLRANRNGIVVLDWSRAFDRLRDAPRIALAEQLLPLYRRHMKPLRMPDLMIIPDRRRAA